jgi:hypothetical protein
MSSISVSKRKHRGAMFALTALTTAGLIAFAAGSGKPKSDASNSQSLAVKGAWIDCNTVSETKQDGDKQLITILITEKFSGTLNGSYEGIERNIVHQDGSGTFHGSGTFNGEINAHSGTAVMTYSGTVDAKGVAHANWVLDQGTDGLVRIDGRGTFEGKETKQRPPDCNDPKSQSAWSGSYTGTVELGSH